jgi:hypothetical protein
MLFWFGISCFIDKGTRELEVQFELATKTEVNAKSSDESLHTLHNFFVFYRASKIWIALGFAMLTFAGIASIYSGVLRDESIIEIQTTHQLGAAIGGETVAGAIYNEKMNEEGRNAGNAMTTGILELILGLTGLCGVMVLHTLERRFQLMETVSERNKAA